MEKVLESSCGVISRPCCEDSGPVPNLSAAIMLRLAATSPAFGFNPVGGPASSKFVWTPAYTMVGWLTLRVEPVQVEIVQAEPVQVEPVPVEIHLCVSQALDIQ